MNTIGLVANDTKPRASAVLAHLRSLARQTPLRLLADPATAALVEGLEARPLPDLFDAVDAVMALGGDGTVLKIARELNGRDCPVVGVNIGGLGFLTSVAEDRLDAALRHLAEDRYRVSARTVAEVTFCGDGQARTHRALNEILVTGDAAGRVVTLNLCIDGEHVTTYACDGLIVSTPTGSTGHSLSAGGPILMPETRVFVISGICPHTLSTRPLVVSDTVEIAVAPAEDDGALRAVVDGQIVLDLESSDALAIRKAEGHVRLLHLPDYSGYAVLRQKLNWRGSTV